MTGAEFRKARKALGWTQADVADAMGVEARTIQRIEYAAQAPQVYALALAYLRVRATIGPLLAAYQSVRGV